MKFVQGHVSPVNMTRAVRVRVRAGRGDAARMVAQLMCNRKIASAAHNIMAYRIGLGEMISESFIKHHVKHAMGYSETPKHQCQGVWYGETPYSHPMMFS